MNQEHIFHPAINELFSVVAIGGGHGLGRVLSSLSFLQNRLIGIVATTDNGGSTGRIRSQHGGIAWGDLRNCLSQINSKSTAASELFEYRFGGNGELAGHNLGNLIFKALEDMHTRPLKCIELVRRFLSIRTELLPMSEVPVHLQSHLPSGETVLGEISIDALTEVPSRLSLSPEVSATPEALNAITQTDLILLGPGSFFTSVMPALLLPDLADAINKSKAKIIFIDNIAKENGVAGTLTLNERIRWIEECIGQERLDGVITTIDNSSAIPSHIVKMSRTLHDKNIKYRHDHQQLVNVIGEMVDMII